MTKRSLWDYLVDNTSKHIDKENTHEENEGDLKIYETDDGAIIFLPFSAGQLGCQNYVTLDSVFSQMGLKDLGCYQYGVRVFNLSKKELDGFRNTEIVLPRDWKDNGYDLYSRRPAYMVRGKRLTREQVKEILKGELAIFNSEGAHKSTSPLYADSLGDLFQEKISSLGSGWLWDTGEIGGNGWSGVKYPEFYELMPTWMVLAMRYHFLDMVVSYVDHNELPCYDCPLGHYYNNVALAEAYWDDKEEHDKYSLKAECYTKEIEGADKGLFPCRGEKIPECEKHFSKQKRRKWEDRKGIDFEENYMWLVDVPQLWEDVVLTIQIKNGCIAVFTGDKAKKLFRDYNEKYHFDNPYRYSADAMELTNSPRIGVELLSECIKECGMDVREPLDYLEDRYDLSADRKMHAAEDDLGG